MITRRSILTVVVLPLLVSAHAFGAPVEGSMPPADRADDKRTPLQITIDRAKVDLPGHKLEITMSHAADKVRIKVVGMSGRVLAEVEKTFGGAAAGTPLAMSWTPASEEDVAKIEVWGHDTEGFFVGVAITPWNVRIPHDEVMFETDSDVVRASEVPKLEASLQKISDAISRNAAIGKITLFILGHTDTMGSTEHNLALSRRRSRAIAAWFKAHGLKTPIAYEGLGKLGLLVKTPDGVDEARNRRVEYILALEPPPFPAGEFSWKTP